MSVLSSSPPRCSHSVTSVRRGGVALETDFSAACAPTRPATYVLVLGLPSESHSPCRVSVEKGDVLGWARLARASTLSSFCPFGTCPSLLRKLSASLFQALALLQCLRYQSPAHLLSIWQKCTAMSRIHTCRAKTVLRRVLVRRADLGTSINTIQRTLHYGQAPWGSPGWSRGNPFVNKKYIAQTLRTNGQRQQTGC